MTAAQLTRALGGRWHGRYGTARCFLHDDHSPSLSIVDGKEGPVVTCFAGCDWREVRAELRRRGFLDDGIRLHQRAADRNFDRHKDTKSPKPAEGRIGITDTEDTARALAIWAEAKQLCDIALKYCISRGISELSLPDIDGVLRFHPHCPFGRGERHPCIVALWTDAITNQAQAIHRTALTPDGKKLGRMSLGPTAGCVLRLWPDELVTLGLVIGEGLETVLAAATRIEHRSTLLQPAWAVGDAGHLAKFPVLAGIETLTILVDHDEAGQRAARECRERWLAAGREVTALIPNDLGQDFNDIIQKDPVS